MALLADIPKINGSSTNGSLTNGKLTNGHSAELTMEERPKAYGWATENENGYKIREVPSGTKSRKRIIVIGAGASGLDFAKHQQDLLENVETVIYEKNAEVSGTWIENKYPGCACDIPSVTYQYIWEPKIWSKFYSGAAEILEYFKGVADKYGLRKYIKLRHSVEHAEWDNATSKWKVKVLNHVNGNTFEDTCDILINASGIFNFWQWPNIKGLDKYKGIKAHSASYPDNLDLNGKRIAIVGTGASGIQLTAALQKGASHMYTWIRTPTWITSGFASTHAGPNGGNFDYSDEQKKRFQDDPVYYRKYIKDIEASLSVPLAVLKNTPINEYARDYATNIMKGKLENRPDLLNALTPATFSVGCKRATPGNGFLEALCEDNVTTYCSANLTELTERGFIDPDGNEVEVDAIVFATGFNTTWIPRIPIIANGLNLQDVYTKNPLSYLGVAAPHMPNYFTFYGPYSPIGQGSVLAIMDVFAKYITQVVEKMQIEDIKEITPKLDAIADYGEHTKLLVKRFVWDSPCRSWMKGGDLNGEPSSYAGTRTQAIEVLATPRYEDYDITYGSRNRWQWLGNGFSLRDVDGKDTTWYWGLVDGKDKQETYGT